MATKSAGRVSIRVLPDSSRFREDLKKSLERIEKTMKATIPAHLEVTRESIRKLRAQLRDLEVRIKVEPYVTQEQLHDLKQKVEEVDPNLRVDLDALNAQRRLAFISRDRTVSLFVRVNQASVAAAASTLAALSGTRLVSNVFEGFFRNVAELDKTAPKIGLISSGIAGLSAVILTAVSNFAGLLGSFAALGQAAVLLPALMFSAGISIGTLIVVLKDMKKVLADLGPAFTRLQDNMSREFWAIAADPIRDMVNTLMPSLNEQLVNTSQAFGVLFRELANALKVNLTAGKLNEMFDNMNQSIAIASNAMAPLVHAFTILGTFGTKYLPRLSTWLVDLSKQFDNFISAAEKSGDLEKWAERGIKEFKDLGRVIKETVRVFAALTRAASAAGGSTFAGLADGLKKLADTMNSANFQTTFATIFAGAHTAMDGLIDGLAEFGRGLASFAPTLAIVFSEVGDIFKQIGVALGDLFSNPTLQQGIQDFFSGFKTFITDITPAMEPLGRIIGTLATALGSLVAQAAPLVVGVLDQLAPLFEELWKIIQPLLPDLIGLADTLIKELGPVLLLFVKEVLPPLIPLIEALVPLIVALVKAVTPVIAEFFTKLGDALVYVSPYAVAAVGWLESMSTILRDFPLALFQGSVGDEGGMLGTLVRIAVDNPGIPAFFNTLNTALGGLFDKIMASANAIQTIDNFARSIQTLAGATALGALAIAIKIILDLLPAWETFWGTFGTVVQTVMNNLPTPVTTGTSNISTTIATFQATVGPAWNAFWGRFGPVVGTGMTLAGAQARLGTAGIAATIVGFIAANLPRWQGWLTGIQILINTRMPLLAAAVRGGIPAMLAAFAGMMVQSLTELTRGFGALVALVPGQMDRIGAGIRIGAWVAVANINRMAADMVSALLGYAGEFLRAGGALIGQFVSGIASGQNPAVSAAIAVVKAALDVLPKSPAKKGPLSGQGWVNLKKSGATVTKQWASGLYSDLSVVQNATGRVVSAVQFDRAGLSGASAASAIGALGGRDDRALVTIEGDYYGATPEKVANEFDKKLRRGSLVAQMGKIGIG